MNLRSERTKAPTCYAEGLPKASELDPDIASNYIAHTPTGDPEADAVVELLEPLDPALAMRYVGAGMDQNEDRLASDPSVLRNSFSGITTVPYWVGSNSFLSGIKMFHRNSKIVLAAFVGGVLIEGFSTNISKPFFITGRLRESGVRRLRQNN